MAELTMPRLSDTMSEGSIGRWLKKLGDKIEKGDIIAEIETDKATMELEAFESGYLQEIRVKEGQLVPIGEVIGMIGSEPGAPAAAPAAAAPAAPTEEGGSQATQRTAEEAKQQVQAPAEASSNGNGKVKASPLAKRMAEELGLDLSQIQGTGPGGRVIKENVEAFAQQKPAAPVQSAPAQSAPASAPAAAPATAAAPAPAPAAPAVPKVAGEVEPLSRMRKAIANAMMASKVGVPHIYVTAEVDMGAAMALRKQINDTGTAKISVNDLVVKAAGKALKKFPALNSSFTQTPDGQYGIVTHEQINVSVAVATDGGLMAVVVRDTDKKSIGAISDEVRGMAGRARDGKAKQSDLEGATFQTTNLGMFDVVEFASIISVPQSASLAVGAVRQVPVVRDGEIVVGQIMNVTVSADHRVADGATAAQFLQELRKLLETPMTLLV